MNKSLVCLLWLAIALVSSLGISQACARHDDRWIALHSDAVKADSWRKVSPTQFLSVNLDMNGDAIADVATLVVSSDQSRSAIKICFGNKSAAKSNEDCSIFATSENIASVMGLDKKPAGCYEYHEDDSGKPSSGKKRCSKNDVLEYFKFGSASSFFIYNQEMKTFDRYWDSD